MTRSILEYSRVAGNVLTSKSKREENRQKRQVEKFYVAAKDWISKALVRVSLAPFHPNTHIL
jgi:hypothetical protein